MAELQLFSFGLNDKNIDDVYLCIFKIPQEIKSVIEELIDEKNKSIASSTIFKVAAALFDEVIYANKSLNNINKDEDIWFYSIAEFDLQILRLKVIEWLREEYKKKRGVELNKEFKEKWKFSGKITLREILNREDSYNNKFSIISNYYVYKLSKNIFRFDSLGRNLKFYRTIEDNKTILMTMPINLENKIYTPFSYYIKCDMKKPIDCEQYVLNVYIKVRVWRDYNFIVEDKNYLSSKESTSIYIYKENEYYENQDILFNRIKIKRDYEKIYKINDASDYSYTKLLEIDVEDILRNIHEYMKEGRECIAFVINKDKKNVNTQYGAGLPERNEMLMNVENILDKLTLRKPLPSISTRGSSKICNMNDDIKEYYDLYEDISKKPNINKERYLLNKNISKVVLNLYTNNKGLSDLSKKLFNMYLRLDKNLIVYENSPDGYNVEIKCMNNDFTREFSIDENKEKRIKEIESLLPKYDKKTLNMALIDIPPYHKNQKTVNRDPKNLIRCVFKDNKILTQFINYDKTATSNIVMNAIKDIISAAGFVEYTLYKDTGVNETDILVGISKVSGGDNENMLAMSKIENGKIYINLYGINQWKELDSCIFSIDKKFLHKIDIGKLDKAKRDGIDQWIMENLNKILEGNKKTYVFIDANIRMNLWKFATNKLFKTLEVNNLRLINKQNLRFIRVNYTDEVPEYFIYDPKNNNLNKKSGVFKGNNNTYYLVGKRQESDQTSIKATKFSCPNKPLRRPSMYEINIVGAVNEQENDFIAIMTQELRRMNISYDFHASLPLPMYVIKRLSEYIEAEKSLT